MKRQPKNEKIVVERVDRQVIANKLLASLEETASVAIIVNKEELDRMIRVYNLNLSIYKPSEMLDLYLIKDFVNDLKRLRKEAFG